MPNDQISRAHAAARHATTQLKQLELRERAGHTPTLGQVNHILAIVDQLNCALLQLATATERENAQRLRALVKNTGPL